MYTAFFTIMLLESDAAIRTPIPNGMIVITVPISDPWSLHNSINAGPDKANMMLDSHPELFIKEKISRHFIVYYSSRGKLRAI